MKKLLLGYCLLVLFSCGKKNATPSPLLSFVPPKTALILKTKDLKKFSETLASNSLLTANKNLPVLKYFKKTFSAFQQIPHTEENLLCFSKIGRDQLAYTFVTQQKSDFFKSEKNNVQVKASFKYAGQKVNNYTWQKQQFFATQLEETQIFSNSKLMIENVIRIFDNKFPPDPELQKIFVAAQKESSLFINNEQFKSLVHAFAPHQSFEFLNNFTDWTEIDLNFKQNAIQFNGVTKADQTTANFINLFQGQKAQPTKIAKITPLNAKGLYSFTYTDFSQLRDKLSFYRKKEEPKLTLPGFFDGAQEIGEIYSTSGTAVAFRAKDTSVTRKILTGVNKTLKEFRGSRIYSFDQPKIFRDALYPLIKTRDLKYYTKLNNFFVFSHQQKTLENLIANLRNNTILGDQKYFKNTKDKLNTKSSIFILGLNENLKSLLSNSLPENQRKAYEKIDFQGYKTSALQFVYDNDFAYINGLVSLASPESADSETVTQQARIKFPEPIATRPRWVKNWRTRKMEIAAQGESNTLYVYRPDGRLHWKKNLDGRILGDIQQIDIYNNGRLQLAFATQNRVYIFDKDGGEVSPFPKKFTSAITQPLAIFDYAHNSHYRFLVVQGKKVSMFDKAGKIVTGFKYHQATSAIIQDPKHIRIGIKDYILIPEKSGELHILNRVGHTRIPIKKKIDFSKNAWYDYQNKFTSVDDTGKLIQIDQSGKIKQQNLNLAENSAFISNGNLAVTFSENTLTIGNQKTELDFGLYTPPELFKIYKKTYVSVTDTQSKKVYLFDAQGKLLPGFPVYGNSATSLSANGNKKKLQLLTKGDQNNVLVYKVK